MKKTSILCLMLTAVLALGSFTGCASSNPGAATDNQGGPSQTSQQTEKPADEQEQAPEVKDPVTLAWWYRGNGEQADTRKVQDAINAMLKEYEGLEHVTVTLECFAPTDYSTQVTLGQTAGQKMDILNTVSISFADQVKNGTYITLDQYLPQLTELTTELPSWLLEMGKINGSTYIIPHYQQATNMIGFYFPKEYSDKYTDVEKWKTAFRNNNFSITERAGLIYDYVKGVQADHGATKYASTGGYDLSMPNYYDTLPASDNTIIVPYESGKVEFWPMTEAAKEGFGVSAQWYTDGVLSPDPSLVLSDIRHEKMLDELSVAFSTDHMVGTDEYASEKSSERYGFDAVVIASKDKYFIGYSWGAGGDGVTASCQNPEEAVRFIEAMNIERGKHIYNTVVYGIDGVHYEKLDETHIKTLGYDSTQGGADYLYSAHKWIMGNTFNAYLNQAVKDEDITIFKQINEGANTISSNLAGLIFDAEAISTELSQVVAVHGEYKDALAKGIMGSNWEAHYDEYISKIQAAGIEKVLSHFQSQLDAFLK